MKKEEFARGILLHHEQIKKFKRWALLAVGLFFLWELVINIVGPVGSSFVKQLFLVIIPLLGLLLLAIVPAFKADRVAKENGLRCPQCKRYQWGVNGLYALQHLKCKRCGYQLIEPEEELPGQVVGVVS